MNRRQALIVLLALVGRAQVGASASPQYNILVDLSVLKGWEIKLGEESIYISGEELFRALKGAK